MKQSKLGFGVVGHLDHGMVQCIASAVEEHGYHSLWFNETPDGDAVQRIAVASAVTDRLVLGTGVINLDAKSAESIVRSVVDARLPLDRVIIGVGASAKPHPLETVSNGVATLKRQLGVPVVVGSLGPNMRKLGAEQANGLLFNWLTPDHALSTTRTMREQAAAAGQADSLSATYIRTALGVATRPMLEREAAKYSAIPSYAANFERLGITALESAVFGETPAEIIDGLEQFDGTVDHAIVRAITADDILENYLALIDAASALA